MRLKRTAGAGTIAAARTLPKRPYGVKAARKSHELKQVRHSKLEGLQEGASAAILQIVQDTKAKCWPCLPLDSGLPFVVVRARACPYPATTTGKRPCQGRKRTNRIVAIEHSCNPLGALYVRVVSDKR